MVNFQNRFLAALAMAGAMAGALGGAVVANGSAGVNVDVSITGFRNMKGQVLVCLTTNPKAFPDCRKDAASLKQVVATGSAAKVTFSGVAPGSYAIALVHDENSNGKLDAPLVIPKEGFGFSRNPAVVFGPPSFKKAQFAVGSVDVAQSVKMKYMF